MALLFLLGGVIRGVVLEEGTGMPVEHVRVEGRSVDYTDENGKFVVEAEEGDTIRIFHPGYERMEIPACDSIVIYLKPRIIPLPGTVVKGKKTYEKKITARELHEEPGFPDIFRLLEVTPSVSALAEWAGFLSIRGGKFYETGYLVDGVPFPFPFHFMGMTGIFPVEEIERISVYPSFSWRLPEWRIGGTVDIQTREPEEEWEVSITPLDAGMGLGMSGGRIGLRHHLGKYWLGKLNQDFMLVPGYTDLSLRGKGYFLFTSEEKTEVSGDMNFTVGQSLWYSYFKIHPFILYGWVREGEIGTRDRKSTEEEIVKGALAEKGNLSFGAEWIEYSGKGMNFYYLTSLSSEVSFLRRFVSLSGEEVLGEWLARWRIKMEVYPERVVWSPGVKIFWRNFYLVHAVSSQYFYETGEGIKTIKKKALGFAWEKGYMEGYVRSGEDFLLGMEACFRGRYGGLSLSFMRSSDKNPYSIPWSLNALLVLPFRNFYASFIWKAVSERYSLLMFEGGSRYTMDVPAYSRMDMELGYRGKSISWEFGVVNLQNRANILAYVVDDNEIYPVISIPRIIYAGISVTIHPVLPQH